MLGTFFFNRQVMAFFLFLHKKYVMGTHSEALLMSNDNTVLWRNKKMIWAQLFKANDVVS